MAHEWFQAPHGWTLEISKHPGYNLLVENPDSTGFCEIYLCGPDGDRKNYGRSFGPDDAKKRAEKIFGRHV